MIKQDPKKPHFNARFKVARSLSSSINKRYFSSTARLNSDDEDSNSEPENSNSDHEDSYRDANLDKYLKNITELEEHREEHRNITERLVDEFMEVDMGDSDNEKIGELAARIEQEESRCNEAVSSLSDTMYNEDRENSNHKTETKDIYTGTEKVIGQVIKDSLETINGYTESMKRIVENNGALHSSSDQLTQINRLLEERDKYTKECNHDISRQIDTVEASEALDKGLPLPKQGTYEPESETVTAGPSGTYVPLSKRKREEDENESKNHPNKQTRAEETSENTSPEPDNASSSAAKSESLLDDFAEPSTESPDYMAGDD